jgi:hypothetical protein
MKLINPANASFALTLMGYQFPALETAPYDSNWLKIRIDVTTSQGSWSAIEPCLLTYEVERLANWLDQLVAVWDGNLICAFIEPCLCFERVVDTDGLPCLRIYFELEVRPPWAPARQANQGDIWIDFPLAAIDIPAATQSLRSQLQRYPQRADV